jgi:hypothetical protein
MAPSLTIYAPMVYTIFTGISNKFFDFSLLHWPLFKAV